VVSRAPACEAEGEAVNIRFAAVDENGREIEDDDAVLHPPVDSIDADAIPRVGEQIMFYNIGDGATWDIMDVVWMVGAYRVSPPYQAVAHACVMIRKQVKA
jgi:hypothetical protein